MHVCVIKIPQGVYMLCIDQHWPIEGPCVYNVCVPDVRMDVHIQPCPKMLLIFNVPNMGTYMFQI